MATFDPDPIDYILVGFGAIGMVTSALAIAFVVLFVAVWTALNVPLWVVLGIAELLIAVGVCYLVGHLLWEGELP